MDSADRHLATLTATVTVLAAEGSCGLAAYILVPLLEGSHPARLACLLPAIALGGLVAAQLWLGGQATRRQLSASRLLAHQVRSLAMPASTELCRGATVTGLADRVDLLDSDERFSFVYGLLRPRVAISRGLATCLSPGELRAALEHERYHVSSHDPLRSLIATALTEALIHGALSDGAPPSLRGSSRAGCRFAR